MNPPDFSYERKLWNKGFKFIAGVDEVGRGCFAGPVVAACVVFAPSPLKGFSLENVKIDDSKKLKPRERTKSAEWIKKNALVWGIGEASASLINRMGMAKATKMAFRQAVSKANIKLKTKDIKSIDFLLIDAFFVSYMPGLPTRRKKDKNGRFKKFPKGKQLAIIDGDEKSTSIAAASIIAKVYRDKLMKSLSKKYPQYGWGRNKGYGTKEHQEAIKKFGITRYHRKQFVTTFLNEARRNEISRAL